MTVDFPPSALPYCSFSTGDGTRRLGVGLGTGIVDLDRAAREGVVDAVAPELLTGGDLDALLAAGQLAWDDLRAQLVEKVEAGELTADVAQDDAELHLAWTVGDYVDFYSSRHHAENLGRMFRPDDDPLLPNWLHMPIGYHGRGGTVVVDGTPIPRPRGQRRTPDGEILFGPSTRLDIELELGWVVGGRTRLGESVPTAAAARHLFGIALVNDWSARDIQAWEYRPLGPFLGKSFATSVAAWVLPLAALAGARVPGPAQDPEPLPYLRTDRPWHLDLRLEVWLAAGDAPATRVAEVRTAEALYWNAAQQLAHLTVNGATIRPGDLFATGTISGSEEGARGSLIELTWNGRDPLDLDGVARTFLEDGDTVELRGVVLTAGGEIPLGPVRGTVVPSA